MSTFIAAKSPAARATVDPALVPAFALRIGLPLTGDAMSAWQWTGLAATTVGLLVASGVVSLRGAPR